MKDDKERNYFSLKNHVWKVPPSHAKMHLESAPQKVNFLMAKSIQKSYTLIATNALALFCIVVMLFRFREKSFYVKLSTV